MRTLAADTPHEISGWDDLSAARSFYVSADWLHFADADAAAPARYFGAVTDGGLVAALPAHRGTRDAGYVAAQTLGGPVGGDVVTLGGRRGFLSGPLVAPGAAGHLAGLIEHAADGPWWWPYLLTEDVDVLPPGRVHLVGADCVVDVAGTGLDDHIAALPTQQRRTNFRREAQRFAASGLTIRRVSLAGHAARLGALLAAVQRKYGHPQTAAEMGERLRRQGERFGDRAVVLACQDGADIIGFALAYRWGDELALRAVGFDYDRLRGADEYAQLAVHAPLRHCYANGIRRLHLGTGSHAAKCRRGARVRPLWAVTSLPAPTARELRVELPRHESESFNAEVEQSWRRWA